jgi:CubicO group peptidase (beta-lactamase class C family)
VPTPLSVPIADVRWDAKLDVLRALSRCDVDAGRLPSAQVALAYDGELVLFETYGDASSSTRYVLQSVGRSLVAGVVWKLLSDELLDLDRTVASYIPEFGTNGKETVTVRQVITHVAGFPLAPLGHPRMLTRASRLEAFGRWKLSYEPGTRLEFHLTSAAWVIAELVERLTGQDLPSYLRDQITGPLGLDSVELGVPLGRQSDVARAVVVGVAPGEDFEIDPWGPWYTVQPDILAAGEPSHSMVATAADVALFFQGVQRRADIWRPDVVAEATRVHENRVISGYQGGNPVMPAGMGYFVQCAGTDGVSRGFLPVTGTESLWGNGGAPAMVGFSDPGTGLSFCWLTNGYPPSGYEQERAGRNRIRLIADVAASLL